MLAYADLVAALERLDDAIQRQDEAELRDMLRATVEGYMPGSADFRVRSRTTGSRPRTRCIEAMLPAHLALAIAVVASAAALSALLIYLLRPVLIRHLLAHPNERSSHVRATPQGAGVGVMLALFLVAAAGGSYGARVAGAWRRFARAPCRRGIDRARACRRCTGAPVSSRFIGQTLAALVIVASLPGELAPVPRPVAANGGAGTARARHRVVRQCRELPRRARLDHRGASGADDARHRRSSGAWNGAGEHRLARAGAARRNARLCPLQQASAKVFLGDAGSLPIGLLLAFMLIYVAGTDLAAALLALYTLADSTITLFRRL